MPLEQLEDKFSKYEIARILGARALQIAMDAPLLLKISDKELEEINYNPLEIAKKELLSEVLPITINRPFPEKKQEKIKALSKKEIEEKIKKEAEKTQEVETKAEKEIEKTENKEAPIQAAEIKDDEALVAEENKESKSIIEENTEIMELATPEDEREESNEDKPVEV